ncbi:glutamate synthase-related protein [Chloroflexota bacterium]
MAVYECGLCGYIYDEEQEGVPWDQLPDDWECPVCGSPKDTFSLLVGEALADAPPAVPVGRPADYLSQWSRGSDALEVHMADIHQMATSGESIIEPMRTTAASFNWDDILIKGAQLARIPLNEEDAVNTTTVIGPNAKHPLVIETPIYVTHMSFGALSREVKIALSKGSAAAKSAMCSGEGGILHESYESAYKYIFEYVPNRYSATDEYLQGVDAIEIKIGQSVKPGMGGHLPGNKVTGEIAAIRGFPEGVDIISPSHFPDIKSRDDLKEKVDWLRSRSGGKPVGIKIAAGNIEPDLEVALYAGPDFITIDGRPGATGAAAKFVKQSASMPTVFALSRARKYLDRHDAEGVSLLITGGLRISPDFAKALALGADAVAIGTAALMAAGCQQYRICHTGRCPMGVATQDPELRTRLDIVKSAQRVANFLAASTEELKTFARMTGNDDLRRLSVSDLCTTDSEISNHTAIEHV